MKILLTVLTLILLTGCADSIPLESTEEFEKFIATAKVGFWSGLWHGMILPFAWVGSLFMDDIAIYALYNNGGWYDYGFFMGIGSLTIGAGMKR